MENVKIIFLTDLHLNRMFSWQRSSFYKKIIKENPGAIIITGDISNGNNLYNDLVFLASLKTPIYFTLGNHEFWKSSFEEITSQVRELCKIFPNLIWLTESDIVPLKYQTFLIGADGWYDGRSGVENYLRFSIDRLYIKEYKGKTFDEQLNLMRSLADNATDSIIKKLNQAIDIGAKTIYIATHFPPYKEASRSRIPILKDFWKSYDINFNLGERVKEIANIKDINIIFISGHVHKEKILQVSNNILSITAKNKKIYII